MHARPGSSRLCALAIERGLAPWTPAIVCVSEAERRLALDYGIGPSSRLRVIHNAATAHTNGLPVDPAFEAFAREGPIAACISSLRPEKGIDIFVDAAPRVFEQLPHARLAVVGNGALRGALERQARALDLDGRLRFFDYRGPSARYLRSTDVFVMASRYEAFGIGLAEALACGVPQLTTGAGGTAEVVRDDETGLLFRRDDPSDLADKLVRLLGDAPLRDRMSRASCERHRHLFTPDRMVDEMVAVFDDVAGRRWARA
jgi:glycosyltransferase involved in cell wall biosynthesis